MIILELISPQQRTIEQKYLLTTQKKSQLLKKKEDRILSPPALLPARDQLQKQQKKANFWSTDPTKNIKRIKKFDPPQTLLISKRIVSV